MTDIEQIISLGVIRFTVTGRVRRYFSAQKSDNLGILGQRRAS